MKKNKNLLFYIATIVGFSWLIYFFIQQGVTLQTGRVNDIKPGLNSSTWDQFRDTFLTNIKYPLAILLLQILTIIIVARIFGFFFKKIGQ
ncbi:MAG: cation/H(+) antiporter, partial [Chitinophagaceae bacterium]